MSLAGMKIGLLAPEIMLFILACIVLLIDLNSKFKNKQRLWDISFAGLLIILISTVSSLLTNRFIISSGAFNGQARIDGLTLFMRIILFTTLFAALIFAVDWLKKTPRKIGVLIFLMMITTLGGLILSSAGDLIVMLIGLEILSLPLYILAGFERGKRAGREASFKYFILGTFASAFMILGIVLIFAASQTTDMNEIFRMSQSFAFSNSVLMKIGLALVLSTLAFKGGLMPFYAWIPDVYTASPDYVVGFMAAVAKIAVFGVLMRIALLFIPIVGGSVVLMLGFLYLLTVILGNLMALKQQDVKRMLAYSSIAHAGYLILGIMAYGKLGFSAILFYLLAYSFVVMGAFIVTGIVGEKCGGYTLDHFNGLSERHPMLALAMAIFMFALAGIPPLAGFWGKLFIFNAAIEAGFTNLVFIGVLTSIIGVYYYIRVLVRIYMKPVSSSEYFQKAFDFPGFFTNVALVLAGLIAIVLGFFPGFFYDAASTFMDGFVKTILF